MLPLLRRELSKCAPLCANCHALVHDVLENDGAGPAFDDVVALVQTTYPLPHRTDHQASHNGIG